MTKELDAKLKTALDESRLLILGAQVLFGFAFQGVFQELLRDVSPASRWLQGAALALLCASVGLLIAPSMYHRVAKPPSRYPCGRNPDRLEPLAVAALALEHRPSSCSTSWPGANSGLPWARL